MPERGLDASWLRTWSQDMSRCLGRLMESFEETHGYAPGDNGLAPADDETHAAAALLAGRQPEHVALLSLYAVIDSVSMPDVGNGYFIHSPSTVVEHLNEYGTVALPNGERGIVFGSDGGGNLFALAEDGTVSQSRTASWYDDFFAAATDLRDFLERLPGPEA